MPVGFQTFDAAGNLLIDITTRLTRLIGSTTITAGSTGSVTVPDATQGTIWYAFQTANGNRYTPLISLSSATISWSPRTGFPGGPVDVIMLYGVY